MLKSTPWFHQSEEYHIRNVSVFVGSFGNLIVDVRQQPGFDCDNPVGSDEVILDTRGNKKRPPQDPYST